MLEQGMEFCSILWSQTLWCEPCPANTDEGRSDAAHRIGILHPYCAGGILQNDCDRRNQCFPFWSVVLGGIPSVFGPDLLNDYLTGKHMARVLGKWCPLVAFGSTLSFALFHVEVSFWIDFAESFIHSRTNSFIQTPAPSGKWTCTGIASFQC